MAERWTKRLTGAALAVASVLLLVLAWRYWNLTQAYAELRVKASLPYAGFVLPTFRAETLDGDTVVVGELPDTTARQLLFVFSSSCPYCRATLPVWEALADSVAATAPVLALTVDSTATARAYAHDHGLRYTVARFPDWKSVRLARASAVPQTLVLDARGRVLFAHTGQLGPGPVPDSVYQALGGGRRPDVVSERREPNER